MFHVKGCDDMDEIVTLVQTVGFPIGMCLILCWYIYSVENKTQQILESLKDTIENLTETIRGRE